MDKVKIKIENNREFLDIVLRELDAIGITWRGGHKATSNVISNNSYIDYLIIRNNELTFVYNINTAITRHEILAFKDITTIFIKNQKDLYND